jgi:microcystin degradation protein MlrC
VTRDAFEALWWLFERSLREAGRLDALLLDLHGAMVVENFESGDQEWLRRVRKTVGRQLPIVAVFDFHANLTETIANQIDFSFVYRSYPHLDSGECGRRAVRILPPLLAGRRYARAMRRVPFLISLPWQTTLVEPMATIMALVDSAVDDDVLSTSFAAGFPLADVPHAGPAVVAYANTQTSADAEAERLVGALLLARRRFRGQLWTADEAVAHAIRWGKPGAPIVIADTQDNPGAGGNGDGTIILRELLDQEASNVCVGLVCDPAAATLAHAAGLGTEIDVGLGGKSGQTSGVPVPGPWKVNGLGMGQFAATGPFYSGAKMDLGRMAKLSQNGIDVIVATKNQQAADRAMFVHVGAEPSRYSILVLKSSVHFRADFAKLAQDILIVAEGGTNIADLGQLNYQRCMRPPA